MDFSLADVVTVTSYSKGKSVCALSKGPELLRFIGLVFLHFFNDNKKTTKLGNLTNFRKMI